MTGLIPAVAYARYSTDKQNARSIDDQFSVCEKTAKAHGYRIVKFYKDEAVSGTGTLARDGWLELMRDRNSGIYQAVIVESLSRMSRDLADSASAFKRLRAKQIDLVDIEGKVSSMRLGLSGIMNEEFVKHLGYMLRRAWDGRVKDGLIPGRPAYGHRTIPGKPFHREIDCETSWVVIRIFTEFADGVPLRDIAARLNAEGIPSPSGGKWNHQVFTSGGNGEGMIGNRSYIGEIVWNKYRSVKTENEKRTKIKNKREEIIVKELPHLRIIDQALWDRAQALRTNRSRQSKQPRVYSKTAAHHPLADKIVCAVCGGRMRIVGAKEGEGKRVGCSNARHKSICENTKSYSLPEIEATVLHGIKHDIDVEALMALTKGAHERWAERQRAASTERLDLERSYNRLTEKIDRVTSAIASLDVELEPLMEKLKALTQERGGVKTKLDLIKAEGNVVTLLPATIRKFIDDLKTIHEVLTNPHTTPDQLHRFRVAFGNVFEKIIVHQTGKRRPVRVTPVMRIAAIMGVELTPHMQSSKEVLEEQGLTSVLLATVGTLGGQKHTMQGVSSPQQTHGIIRLGPWQRVA